MPNRSQALQLRQWGEETTHGTAVAADHIAPNLKLTGSIVGDANMAYPPSGHLYQRDSVNGMYSAKGTYELPWAFDELYVVFNSLLKAVTATGATLTKTRLWTPAVNALDVYKSYSAECGQTGSVDKLKYLVFNSLKTKIGKTGMAPITGDWLAQWNGVGTALTASPTVVTSSLIPKTAWNAYTATSFANLASAPTQILNWQDVEMDFGPVRSEAAFINSSNPGWDDLGIATAIKNAIKVTVPKDVSGSDYAGPFNLGTKAAGTLLFLRLAATGNLIEHVVTDFFQTLTIDMCLKIQGFPVETGVGPFAGYTWPLELTVDPVSGKAWEITDLSTTA